MREIEIEIETSVSLSLCLCLCLSVSVSLQTTERQRDRDKNRETERQKRDRERDRDKEVSLSKVCELCALLSSTNFFLHFFSRKMQAGTGGRRRRAGVRKVRREGGLGLGDRRERSYPTAPPCYFVAGGKRAAWLRGVGGRTRIRTQFSQFGDLGRGTG